MRAKVVVDGLLLCPCSYIKFNPVYCERDMPLTRRSTALIIARQIRPCGLSVSFSRARSFRTQSADDESMALLVELQQLAAQAGGLAMLYLHAGHGTRRDAVAGLSPPGETPGAYTSRAVGDDDENG